MIFGAVLRQASLAAALAANGEIPVVEETILVVAERGAEPADRVPAAVTRLRPEDVSRLPAQTLAEWVDLVPGIQMLFAGDFGGTPMSSARGFFGAGEAEYVQLRVDGTPLYDPESGVGDWRRLRGSSIAQVEALRGAASSLYGDTALGGVVDVRTVEVTEGRGRRSAWGVGSFSTLTFDSGFDWGKGVRWHLDASGSKTDGYREFSEADEMHLGFAVADGGDQRGVWKLASGWSERERADGGPLPLAALEDADGQADPRFADDRDESRRRWATFRYQSGGWQAALYGVRRDADVVRTLLFTPELADTAHRRLNTQLLGGELQHERRFMVSGWPSALRAGVEVARETMDTRYLGVDDAAVDARRQRLAGFATQGFDVHDRVRITAGLRWDGIGDRAAENEERHEAWSPRLGVTWRLGRSPNAASVFAQASRAFKTPTIDQLFDPRPFPDFAGGTFHISNPQLLPQRARTVEVGARGGDAGERWELALYDTAVEDEIDFDPATFTYRNIGSSLHRGIEAAAWLRQRGRVRPFATYAWTRVEPRGGEHRGRQLKNIPRHLLRAGLQADLGRSFTCDLVARWNDGRFLDDAEQVELPAVWVVDLRLRRELRRGGVYLDLLNLTDRAYAALGYVLTDLSGQDVALAIPAPGFGARAGFDLRF